MIRYSLLCPRDHGFESWFRDSAAFDALATAGQVACPSCGATAIRKALMAPSLVTGRRKAAAPSDVAAAPEITAPSVERMPIANDRDRDLRAAMRDLHRRITANASDVGRRFATEARAIHEGSAPERAIYGEATREEVGALLEDGVPLMPMPTLPDEHN